jgi:hypothetical protein
VKDCDGGEGEGINTGWRRFIEMWDFDMCAHFDLELLQKIYLACWGRFEIGERLDNTHSEDGECDDGSG